MKNATPGNWYILMLELVFLGCLLINRVLSNKNCKARTQTGKYTLTKNSIMKLHENFDMNERAFYYLSILISLPPPQISLDSGHIIPPILRTRI